MASFTSGHRRLTACARTWEQVCQYVLRYSGFSNAILIVFSHGMVPPWSDLGPWGKKKPTPDVLRGGRKTLLHGSTLLAWPMGTCRFVSAVTGGPGPVYCPATGVRWAAQEGAWSGCGGGGSFQPMASPLGPGAGKVPVGACVLTRVLYACGGKCQGVGHIAKNPAVSPHRAEKHTVETTSHGVFFLVFPLLCQALHRPLPAVHGDLHPILQGAGGANGPPNDGLVQAQPHHGRGRPCRSPP